LVLNSKKIEETIKSVVETNKKYFDSINSTGISAQEKIKVKYPTINEAFMKDVELDPKTIQQIVS